MVLETSKYHRVHHHGYFLYIDGYPVGGLFCFISGFFGPDCIRPFDRETVQRDLKDKKFKTKDLESAVHQALDPSILKAEEEAEAAADEDEEDEEQPDGDEDEEEEQEEKIAEDDDEEEEEEEAMVKPKRKERKKSTPTPTTTQTVAADKKKKPSTSKKRAVLKKMTEDEDEEEAEDNEDAMETTPPPPPPTQPKKTKATVRKAQSEKIKRARLEPESATESDRKKRVSLDINQRMYVNY